MTNPTELFIAVDDAHFDPDSHRSRRCRAREAMTPCTAADAAAVRPVDMQELHQLLGGPAPSEQGPGRVTALGWLSSDGLALELRRDASAMTSAKLGTTQSAVLRRLGQKRDGGIWYPGCGWIWDNVSRTVRVMESLARRGLVDAVPGTNGRPTQYRINKSGRSWIAHRDPVQQIVRAVAERSAAAGAL